MPGGLSFVAPWALGALVLLPALWWLLRLVPPSPKRQVFPAIGLLFGLTSRQREAARTPIWLVVLRLLLAALVVVATAHPILNAAPAVIDGPLLVVVDNGWASARSWPERRAAIDRLLDQAERDGRAVALLATAPSPDGGPVVVAGPLPPARAKSLAGALQPSPWNTDRAQAAKALAAFSAGMRTVWFADGIDGPGAEDLARILDRRGPLDVVVPPEGTTARILSLPLGGDGRDPTVVVRHIKSPEKEPVAVLAEDSSGRVLARAEAAFDPGTEDVRVPVAMPVEMRNRIARFAIEGEESAAATVLLDDRYKRRPVGLLDREGSSNSPLLDDLFYVEKALSPLAEVRRGTVADLLKRELAMVVVPDGGALSAEERAELRRWVEGGGVLVRLGGPKLARNPDDFLPVQLLRGGRTLGGAMSWTQPMAVAPMTESGPFAGLSVPPDLKIQAQVLAEPTLDLNGKTWARLADGTPLVTGAQTGKGWVVLIHTTVGPDWSNLGLSGLLPGIMGRLLDLGQGFVAEMGERALPPLDLLDGFGHQAGSTGVAESLEPKAPPPVPGPRHPPGIYGTEQARYAFNLGAAIGAPSPLSLPAGANRMVLGERPPELDLQPALLLAALALLFLDMAAVLWIKGALSRRAGRAVLVVAAGLAVCGPAPGRAASVPTLDKAEQAALTTRLAYVETGDGSTDEISRAGLEGLTATLARRTTAMLGEPFGVDVEHDALAVYPLLYWPVTGRQAALSPAARGRVNDFLRKGGLILFDTRDRGDGGPEALARLTEGLDIPPLTAATEQHVLSHSFYLLNEYPGRWAGGAIYVENGGDPANDNVSPVVIGSADWAGAWALDRSGGPLFAAVPGGEAQREMAYRFGINLVMYALTGSYKADQVHLPAILERMKR